MSIRVLHFYKTYYPETMGGTEQVINQLARSTLHLGIQTDVLSLSSKYAHRTVEIHGHLAHSTRMNFEIASTGFSASAFSRFAKLAKKVDLIHYHYPWPFMDLVHFMTGVKKPSIVTYHSDIIRQKTLLQLYKPLRHQFLTSVDQIIATSPNYLETSKVLTRFRHKTTVIPIGLDKATYPPPSNSLLAKWRRQLGDRFFLFVGLLRYYKGLHILLDAMVNTPCTVVIVGSGPIENELKKQASRLNLKHVIFLGALPDEDKIALLTLCYAIVFPSHLRSEAFGIALLEGAMHGKPMISCDIGTGSSYININQETGLVVQPNDSAALKQAMLSLWENPLLAEEMGRTAEKRYWSLFTAQTMASHYVDVYSKVLNRGLNP